MSRYGATSYAGSVFVIHQALQSYGVDANALVRELGIDLAVLRRGNARIAEKTYDELVYRAVEASKDPAFGIRYAEHFHAATFHALGFALLASETIRDFCERWVRYFALINTDERVEFQEDSKAGSLYDLREASNAKPAVERAHEDAFLAIVIKFIRAIYKPDYVPLRITSRWPRPKTGYEVYRNYFGIEPEFDADRNAVVISRKDLGVPLPAAHRELARHNDQVVVDFLARMNKIDLPAQVNRKLIDLLPSGECSNEKVARALNMSVRALYNKLNKAGTSYQELLDDTRRQLAQQYIDKQDLSVSEIAYLLGFNDCSNFSRAFKRWSGQSPTEYRERSKAEA